MGRKKIKIKTIENERQKNVTFSRRRGGLIKKAHELAVLCDCKVVLLMFDAKDACHIYSSVENHEDLIGKYYRKEFKTIDARKKSIARFSPQTSLISPGKVSAAMVNKYKISTNGEGSENIRVKQIKNEHNPGAVLFSLGAPISCPDYSRGGAESDWSGYDVQDYNAFGGSSPPEPLHTIPSQLQCPSNASETYPNGPPIIHYPDVPPIVRETFSYPANLSMINNYHNHFATQAKREAPSDSNGPPVYPDPQFLERWNGKRANSFQY